MAPLTWHSVLDIPPKLGTSAWASSLPLHPFGSKPDPGYNVRTRRMTCSLVSTSPLCARSCSSVQIKPTSAQEASQLRPWVPSLSVKVAREAYQPGCLDDGSSVCDWVGADGDRDGAWVVGGSVSPGSLAQMNGYNSPQFESCICERPTLWMSAHRSAKRDAAR